LLEVVFHVGMDGIGVADSFECWAFEVPDSATVTVARALEELMFAGG
jgi:hypothetical protein